MASRSVQKPQKPITDRDATSPITDNSGTRQSRVRRKEGAIVSAARDMFLQNGYSGTTMAMIARHAGVADGTLYTYFENKDALARGVIADFYARLMATAQDGVDGRDTTRSRLEFLARHHLSHMMDERGIVEMLPIITNGFADYTDSALYAYNKQYVATFDRIIREGQAAGDIPDDRLPWILRDVFFGALDYGAKSLFMRSARGGGKKADLTRLVDRLVGMIVGVSGSTGSLADRLEDVADRLETALKQTEQK